MVRIRRASGGREEGLLKGAEALRRSSHPLLPERARQCPPEPFDRLSERFEQVREAKDDLRRLDRMRRWGDPFARAYAGFLRFYLEPDLPALLPARVGGSEVSYAPLARAPAEFQIAVQQHDDPRRLLLGYLALARKGFYFYALRDRVLCCGRDPTPPAEFLRKQDDDLPYRFARGADAGTFLCPHLARNEAIPWVGVNWTRTERSFRVCQRCAKEDAQLLGALSSGFAQPRAEDAFEVACEQNVDCRGGPDCPHRSLPPVSRALRKRYLAGRISDRRLVEEYGREVEPYLARNSRRMLLAGGICFGSDAEAFVAALHPNRVERTALEQVLPSVAGRFSVEEPTASQALERLWHDHADEIVAAIEPDEEGARRLVQEARAAPGRVSELLRRAAQRVGERTVLGELPQFTSLSPEAQFVDAIGRSFRVGGASAAERRIEQTLPREGKERGIAWGLLLALGRNPPHAWQFSDSERRFGESLAESARQFLETPAPGYREALHTLLAQAGVAGPLD
ncbi:MAG: hypothetical protein ACREC5_02420 [Thermoplasmata archaeon]